MATQHLTVSISASMSRWSTEAIIGEPVAIIRVSFRIVCNLAMLVALELGNHFGAA